MPAMISPSLDQGAVLVRRADEADRPILLGLLQEMWGRDVADRYDWLYCANPHGHALTWLALDRSTGETVGCKSLIPRKMLVEGRVRLAAIGSDAYVRPAWRGSGVATRLQVVSREEMLREGIAFAPGVPAGTSRGGLLRAGASTITSFERWVTPLTGAAVLRRLVRQRPLGGLDRVSDGALRAWRRLRMPPVRGLTMQALDPARADLGGLAERMMACCRVTGIRDGPYLAWRYQQAPAQRQSVYEFLLDSQVVAIGALEVQATRAMVVDLFGTPEPRLLGACLLLMLDHLSGSSVSTVEIFCTARSLLARLLPGLGFMRRESSPMIVIPSEEDSQLDALRSDAWYFMLGDLDGDAFIPSATSSSGIAT